MAVDDTGEADNTGESTKRQRSSRGRRTVMKLSMSPGNPDAVLVTQALQEIPKGQQSAVLLSWAAAYLRGEARLAEKTPEEDPIDVEALEDLFAAL